MQFSVAGVLVCFALLLGGYYLRAPLVIPLLASLAFGATAIATLDFLGGSSPLIFTVFSVILFASIAVRRDTLHDFGALLARHQSCWFACMLPAYALISAIILPRLFAGQTTTFVPARTSGHVFEVPLQPVSGNVTQLGYLTLGILTFFALTILLRNDRNFEGIRRGFFTLATIHAALGTIDLSGKLIGNGDLLAPLRTASYALLTEASEAGFWRIVGGYSEASAYGGATLVYLAFVYTYWRATSSRPALLLALVLGVLLVLSTSTAAYAGGAALALMVIFGILYSAMRDRLRSQDLVMLGLVVFCITLGLFLHLHHEKILGSFAQLLDSVIFNKSLSASAQERMYWNYKSLQSLFDTAGLGIGFGSSRSSSWPIAVVSQLGLVGTFMLAALVAPLLRNFNKTSPQNADLIIAALGRSARASALAGLGVATIAGSGADPGLLFFISLATVIACRDRLSGDLSFMHRSPFCDLPENKPSVTTLVGSPSPLATYGVEETARRQP